MIWCNVNNNDDLINPRSKAEDMWVELESRLASWWCWVLSFLGWYRPFWTQLFRFGILWPLIIWLKVSSKQQLLRCLWLKEGISCFSHLDGGLNYPPALCCIPEEKPTPEGYLCQKVDWIVDTNVAFCCRVSSLYGIRRSEWKKWDGWSNLPNWKCILPSTPATR